MVIIIIKTMSSADDGKQATPRMFKQNITGYCSITKKWDGPFLNQSINHRPHADDS
jgi:hypothetical protein